MFHHRKWRWRLLIAMMAGRDSHTGDWLAESAQWAFDVASGHHTVPDELMSVVAGQTASLLAAAVSGGRLPKVQTLKAVLGNDLDISTDDAWLSVAGACKSFEQMLAVNAASSMAQDYDDFLWMGHCGHSAVWASILPLPPSQGSLATDWRRLVVIGNELGGRLGAACLLGPQNGQMWNFIHRLSGATIFALRCGASAGQVLQAQRLALYQANAPVYQGFFASDAKLLTAAEPLVAAWRAAQLALAGWQAEGPALEGEGGFLDRFAFLPLPGLLSGLGESFVTRTMVIKTAPGCAYLIPAVEALEGVAQQYTDETGQRLAPEEVVSITVRCSLMTLLMDQMADQAMARSRHIHAVAVNFSVRWSLALALLTGKLDGRVMTAQYLSDNEDVLAVLAGRIRVVHDGKLSWQVIATLQKVLPLRNWLTGVSLIRLLPALRRMRKSTSVRIPLGKVALDLMRHARPLKSLLFLARRRMRRHRKRANGTGLARADFSRPALRFPVQLEVLCRDGSRWQQYAGLGRGTAGTEGFAEAVHGKWRQEIGQEFQDFYDQLTQDDFVHVVPWYRQWVQAVGQDDSGSAD